MEAPILENNLFTSSNSSSLLSVQARESGIHWTLLINSICLIVAIVIYVLCLRRMRIFKKRGTFVPKWVSGEGEWAGKVQEKDATHNKSGENAQDSIESTEVKRPHLLMPQEHQLRDLDEQDEDDEQVEIVVNHRRPRAGSLLHALRGLTSEEAPEATGATDASTTTLLDPVPTPILTDATSSDSLSSRSSTSPILSSKAHTDSKIPHRHCLSFITKPLYNLWLSIWYEQQYHSFGAFYGHQITLYLFLSKQITLALFFCSVLSCLVLLPLHISGVTPSKQVYTPAEYGSFRLAKDDYFLVHTTISMVVDQPGKMYVHVCMALIFICIVLGFLRRFTESRLVKNYPFEGRKLLSDYSLRLDDLPAELVSNELLKKACNLPEIFDGSVTNSRITFQTSTRINLEKRHRQVCKNLKHYEVVQQEKAKKKKLLWWWGKRTAGGGGVGVGVGIGGSASGVGSETAAATDATSNPVPPVDTESPLPESPLPDTLAPPKTKSPKTFIVTPCFPFIKRVDAIKHYTALRIALEEKMRRWDENFLENPVGTGTAYILFHSSKARQRALAKSAHNTVRFTIDVKGPKRPLKSLSFLVSRASEPSDIMWENASISREARFTRMVAVNFFIILYLMVFSSPLALISSMQSFLDLLPKNIHETIDGMRQMSGPLGDLVYQYLPTLLLLVLSSTLPYVIPVLTSLEKYYTYSTYAFNTIYRLYLYLLLTTLILPTFALTSMDGLLKYLQFKNLSQSLQNLFLPGSGVFFVNYCIQYLFWSTIIDLLRIGDVIRYLVRRVSAVGEQEKRESAQVAEFDFPLEYGYLLSFFALSFTYGLFSPLIFVLGFTYFLLKYLLDARNIVYLCSKNKKSRHNVMPDVKSYKRTIMLLAYIIFSAVLIFELFQVMFYAKAGQDCFVHLAVMVCAFIATVIYIVIWGFTYRINGAEMQKSWRLGSAARRVLRRAAGTGMADSSSQESVDPLISSAAEQSGNVELHPMELGNQEAFDLAYVPPFSPIGIELTVGQSEGMHQDFVSDSETEVEKEVGVESAGGDGV